MELILLERVENLGQMGDVVKVRPGYARNYLLPQKKALRANEANKKVFEAQKVELEARNLERRQEAEDAAKRINGKTFIVIRQSSEAGALYGSVSPRDIADAANADDIKLDRNQVRLAQPIKALGIFDVKVALHPEVVATVHVNVARSADEAERQARGENIFGRDEDELAEEDNAAEFFDEETGEAAGAEASDADATEEN